MAWRFRRSAKFGPFRLTATKTGLSGSIGVPGARVGINSKGQVRRTVGIPGTGIYDTAVIGTRHDQPDPATTATEPRDVAEAGRRRWGPATTMLFIVMTLTIIGQAIALASR